MNAPSRSSQALATQIHRRLDRYVLACSATAAGAAALTITPRADGGVVYSGLQNLPIPILTTDAGVYFDLEPPFTSDDSTRPTGWEVNSYLGGSVVYVVPNGDDKHAPGAIGTMVVMLGGNAANLPLDVQIDGTSAFSEDGFYGGVDIADGQTGYIGFKFDPDVPAGVQTYYGWFRMVVNTSTGGRVVDWAYDNTGAGIKAGAVPEPGSLAMLAMGALGLSRWRRRRSQNAE